MRYLLTTLFSVFTLYINGQICDCEKEYLHVKKVVEQNFAGYPDRVKALSKAVYKKKTRELQQQTRNKFASDNCPLIISHYLELFKSKHLGFSPAFDARITDTAFAKQRPLYTISEEKLLQLQYSTSWEGIYYFTHDSSYKIAVIKDPTPLHDYIGVLLESKIPGWKKGMIKLEGKLVNDSLLFGLLYMRNHRPKREYFGLFENKNKLSGDWRRAGSVKPIPKPPGNSGENLPPIYAKLLTPETLCIGIVSFDPDYKPMLDSVLKANESLLNTIPNLVLDLRYNGGGSDHLWEPLLPFLYTSPIRYTGVDILSTPTTISGWKKYLENENLPAAGKADIEAKVGLMEKSPGKWVNISDDQVDSSMVPRLFPKNVVILINKWCGSSTEEFLLAARQSTKVILAGETTTGNLDYSNVVQTPFSCFPYTLRYASTRSRRLDINQGIDNIGIVPHYPLTQNEDWLKAAVRILEK